MAICVVGDPADASSAYAAWLAGRRGIEVLELAEDRLGVDWFIDGGLGVELGTRRIPMEDITGALVRLNPRPSVAPQLGLPAELTPLYSVERRQGLHWMLEQAPFPVANRPWAGRSNNSKPAHMRRLADLGMNVPDWVATSDPAEVSRLLRRTEHGAVYKACSGLRSRVRLVDEQLLERLRRGSSPVVAQAYVPGADARVHLVGSRTFATLVHSEGVDYRFEGHEPSYEPVCCPDDVAELCLRCAQAEGLLLAGIDFRVAEDNSWWCLEMNPVPTYLPYEAGSGESIGDAIIDLLAPGTRRASSESPLAQLARRVG